MAAKRELRMCQATIPLKWTVNVMLLKLRGRGKARIPRKGKMDHSQVLLSFRAIKRENRFCHAGYIADK